MYHTHTDSKTPFRGENPKWHFWNQKRHFGFSLVPAETPIFVVFGDFVWLQKGVISKQIVATKMRVFLHLRNTDRVCLFLKKEWHFWQKNLFAHNHPKNTIFLGFLWNCPFHIFDIFSFSFPNKDQNKKCTPWQTAKKLYSHLYTPFVIFKIPQKHYETGEEQAKKILDQVLTQPWTKFWLNKTNLGQSFDSTAHIYML